MVTFLHGEIYHDEYGFTLDFEMYVAETLATFCRQFDDQKDRVWICEHDQKVIGFLSLFGQGDIAQLRYFVLRPEYRGIGLGKKLMSLFLQFMEETGVKSAYLLTTGCLDAARGLYERFGFRLIEERKSIGFQVPETEQRYELHLT